MIPKVISYCSAHACAPTESVNGIDTYPAMKPCLGRTLPSPLHCTQSPHFPQLKIPTPYAAKGLHSLSTGCQMVQFPPTLPHF